ncbi:MAG: type VI secretion system baseplate subunit TssK [Gemmatimonadaceae bacterium]
MRQMQPVLWTKGVMLSPQHLQTQDRFLEDLLEFQLSTLTYCPWGFSRLEIDHEALAGGMLALSAAAGIFPDGLLFDMPAPDPLPPPKMLEGLWEQDTQSLDIVLAVPEYRPGGHNVSAAHAARDTRYRVEVISRRDENTGLAEKPIQVAQKNVRLLAEAEAGDGSSALRVARVRRATTGEFSLDPSFIPPLLDTAASARLAAINRQLVEILSAKSTMLAGGRRQRNQSLADFGITDVANFWLLYTINTHFPQLRHIYETRRGHPSALYGAMLALAGALTTFSSTVHPRDLPPYDHADLARCFGDLDQILRDLLETVVPSTCISLPMREIRPTIHATALDEDRYLAAPQLYLAVSAQMKADDLLKRAPQLIKVSAADHVDRLVRQALSGVSLTHVPSPPTAVPVKLDFHYFLLGKSGDGWDAVVRSRNLAAYVPAEFMNAQLELVIVLPPRG